MRSRSLMTRRRRCLRAWHALALGISCAVASTAHAADPPRAVPAIAELSRATDDAGRIVALQRIASEKPRGALGAIDDLLGQGQADAVTDAAIETLGALAAPDSRALLVRFTKHRRIAARARAFTALSKLPGSEATAAVAKALRDASPEVRALGTKLLAERGARETLDLLFLALERGVPEAALAIGKLADEAAVPRLGKHIGKAPLDALLAGYQALLCRRDVSDATKLGIVAALEEVSGPAVHGFFIGLPAREACVLDARTRASVRTAALRTREKAAKAAP